MLPRCLSSWGTLRRALSTDASAAAAGSVGQGRTKKERMRKALEEAAMRRRGENMTTYQLDIDTPRGPQLGGKASRVLSSPTGGEGKALTSESASLAVSRERVRSLYRSCLREVPEIQRNFFLVEGQEILRKTLKWLFMQNSNVKNPQIVDVLVFKGAQELEEYQRQWKGRHHLYQHVAAFQENEQRLKNAELVRELVEADSRSADSQMSDSTVKQMQLETWKEHKLISNSIDTWAQYVMWRKEEDERFAHFAEEHGLFTREELEQNRKAAFARSLIPT
ncbi:NADH dehydrogenase ubiquinone 1 alpha subcomplex subunit 6 [Porphyridium purpureum]|uniref:NADH dehydrogenase ubiquinone 1 alpha subcomplex subunit 6 n=1 Tax=Porphyridium purpureum TaxID=35688 RepID=A0A5J4YPU8_PORPP|nr:NADH dehydrogenase ubiquinone 1 alpha subcomplex subunit 6 [Porphyridium purpureum]|eukprot:POR4701..scf222_8